MIIVGLEGLVEAEVKHTKHKTFDLPRFLYTPKQQLFETPGPKVPNMQSAFRVSKSAIFEQSSPSSLGKRPLDHIPQAVMDSIEGLVDPAKVIVVEARRPGKTQNILAMKNEAYLENIENMHPNLPEGSKQIARPFITDAFKTRTPMGLLSLKEEAQI